MLGSSRALLLQTWGTLLQVLTVSSSEFRYSKESYYFYILSEVKEIQYIRILKASQMMRSIRITETLYHYHCRKISPQSHVYNAKTSIVSKYGIISLQLATSSAAHTSENVGEHRRTQV